MLALVLMPGCEKRTPRNHYPSNGGGGSSPGGGGGQEPPAVVTANKRTDWWVRYEGRSDFRGSDGRINKVEDFSFHYTGSGYFFIRTLTADDYQKWYSSDPKSLIEGEVKDLNTIAENEDRDFWDSPDVFTSKDTETNFNIMLHGDYLVFLIEVDNKGKATYDYCSAEMTVVEERALDNYLRWIGKWHVADDYAAFDITISHCENNYLYYIDGWETGRSVSTQMNMDEDWIYGRYRNEDGALYFFGQYRASYEDKDLGTWVDEMFVGTYLTSNSDENGIVDDEGANYGFDIAHTVINGDNSISIVPEQFSFPNGFLATYHSMRYSRFCYDEKNWAHYNNSGVPWLPLRMTAISTGAPLPTKGLIDEADRYPTKNSLRRRQPKVFVERN